MPLPKQSPIKGMHPVTTEIPALPAAPPPDGFLPPGRRAPKVTVTRQGDSLCQKGCYQMACFFWFDFALAVYSGCQAGVAATLHRWRWSAAGSGCGAAGPSGAEPPAVQGSFGPHIFPGRHGRAWRRAAISFRPRSTASFSANGFKPAFSRRNRCFVSAVTSALASTRASGVWAAP